MEAVEEKIEKQTKKESFIKAELKKYNITDATIGAMAKTYMNITVLSPRDKKGYTLAHEARMKVKGKRVGVEKKRKDLKAESIRFGNAVDAEAKRIKDLLLPIEEHLISQEKIVDDEKDRIKAENERIVRERVEAEEAERKRIEEARQAEIRAEQEAEADRLEKIRQEQEEREELIRKQQAGREAKIREEKEKIRLEQEKKQAEIDAELETIENEKRIIREHREKENERIRIENEEKEMAARAKVEAEQLVKRKEEEKRKAEEQAKRDEELRLALMPDKEKLLALADVIESIYTPSLSHEQSYKILKEAIDYLKKACEVLRKE